MYKKVKSTLVAGVFLFGCGSLHAELKGDAAAGEAKAAMCIGCHGAGGNSELATFPRLAGQFPAYITKQVRDFKKAVRTNSEAMAGMAAMVASDQDAMDIGAYFSAQKMAAKPLVEIDAQLSARGEQIYAQGLPDKNVYGCVNCHGDKGKGKNGIPYFPVVGGQHQDYLIKQLTEFRSGARANDPAGMMANVAKGLTDDDIKAVSNYLSSLLP